MTDPSEIVPDGFDLQSALGAPSSTPEDDRNCCPECGSVNIQPKVVNGKGGHRKTDDDYHCIHCQHTFDQPATVQDVDENPRVATDGGRIQAAPIENDNWHSRDTRRGQLVLTLAEYPLAGYAFVLWAAVGVAIAVGAMEAADRLNFILPDWAVLAIGVGWFVLWFFAMQVETEADDKRCPECDFKQPSFCRHCPSCGHRYDPLELGTGAIDADALEATYPHPGGVDDD